MASRYESHYQISFSNVNLNEPQEISLDDFHEYQQAQLGFANACMVVVVPNRQVSVGVVPSVLLMQNTLSLPEECTNLRNRVRGDPEDETMKSKHKRQIKNRESAARSRARKLAYRSELENKVKCLEEELNRLKQQKEKEAVEIHHLKQEPKRSPLRRANSSPL